MKHRLKVVGIGVTLGLVLLASKQAMNIPDELFMKSYWIFGVVVVLGAVLFNGLYHRSYLKKMKSTAVLLEQGKPKEYIQAVETLRQRAKGRYLHKLYTLNLSAGYCDLRDYKKALELLKSLENERLYQDLKLVYHINLCVCYFYDGQGEKALACYENSQTLLRSPLAKKRYGGNIAVLEVFALIERGELDNARELLATARETWTDSRLQDDFDYLEQRLQSEPTA